MNLSDRMKFYESYETKRRVLPTLPVIARLDGRSFHSFTKGLDRPYDDRLSDLMIEVTMHLVKETNALIGYTQSDEISLVFYSDNIESQIYFDGKIFKMTSILAAETSVKFNTLLSEFIPEKADKSPTFDCRVWNVPTKEEAVNCLLWRQQDAIRNSISMAAQSCYSHKQLQNKNIDDMQKMLLEKDIVWTKYPPYFRHGVYAQRYKIIRKFTDFELECLPLKHEARKNPNLEVEKTEIRLFDDTLPIKMKDSVNFIFGNHELT